MKRKMLSLILVLVVALMPLLTFGQVRVLKVNDLKVSKTVQATPDLYIKDTPADTGIEPNPDTGPMWVTEDIWVRNNTDPGYQPFPFPELTPPWTPLPHENPEYRDPKYSTPNYVYIRVRNRGTAASTGTERLRLYWAKASTGLGWPAQWVDYMASNCGPSKLYGAEVTKPRKNAATATTPSATLTAMQFSQWEHSRPSSFPTGLTGTSRIRCTSLAHPTDTPHLLFCRGTGR